MTVTPSTHLRMQVNETRTVVSVFNGNAEVQHGAETTVVGKKQSLTLDAEQRRRWRRRFRASRTMRGTRSRLSTTSVTLRQPMRLRVEANAFGSSDLNYYGSFINAGGYGSFWQPYFVGAGWSPYANGLWAFYPGAGYSWVSPYPWGWLPYHSGSWSFFPGYGWGWQPGGTFNGLNNVAMTGMSPNTGLAYGNDARRGSVPANGVTKEYDAFADAVGGCRRRLSATAATRSRW